jgi:Uncharacterized protein conserved in bacteria (DUF2059)
MKPTTHTRPRRTASVTLPGSVIIGLTLAVSLMACDGDNTPLPQPTVPPAETGPTSGTSTSTGTSAPPATGNSTSGGDVAAVSAALSPDKTFAEVLARVTPLFSGQETGRTQTGGTQAAGAGTPTAGQLQARLPEVIAYQKRLLEHEFTTAELHQISAFVATPAGQKFVATLPQIQRQTLDYAMQMANELVATLIRQEIRSEAGSTTGPATRTAPPAAGNAAPVASPIQ